METYKHIIIVIYMFMYMYMYMIHICIDGVPKSVDRCSEYVSSSNTS